MAGRSYTAPNTDYRFGFTGLNKDDEINGAGNVYSTEFRELDTRLVTWWSIDPLTAKYPSHSPYNYTEGNPIVYTDRTGKGKESTHTDKDGNVLAVYNDGDKGIYKHDDAKNKGDIDKKYSKSNTSAGGVKMGSSLQTYSFADFDELEKGNIVPSGRIDFKSEWAKESVNNVLWSNKGKSLFYYALNARNDKKFDIKVNAEKSFGSKYYGSKLYKVNNEFIYASARDAGNFAAGMIQQSSILPNYIISVGFGAYNKTKSVFSGALLSAESILLDGLQGIPNLPKSSLTAPSYGEDQGSAEGIRLGRDYYKQNNGGYLSAGE